MSAVQPLLPLAAWPATPQTLAEVDLPHGLLSDLLLRRIYTEGTTTLQHLGNVLKLPLAAVEFFFRRFRDQRILDVKGIIGEDYHFSLTTAGQRLAMNRMRVSQYVGPAPVSLRDYTAVVRAQAAKVAPTRENLREAFSDLVLTDEVIEKIGPALISQKALFLYGPTGNGKTCIAERLRRVFTDSIIVPYAIETDGQIVVFYDPVLHQARAGDFPDLDPRWVVCRRPAVIVGGELTPAMLELKLDEISRTYSAPLQLKANNGILIIDDFGRQVITPRKLLNRWIVPLDRRVDYLTLRYGVKFEVPFELMVVFATNLDPSELADEAFLRRIHNKIYISPVTEAVFDEIFRRHTAQNQIECEPDAAPDLRREI
ncbi:MAG: AAA family ATPase, partial [Acidobacteria bacterium]|nr:AAA family ATPase [Acidobacteriota bacterium]